jgi:hypothetical protein
MGSRSQILIEATSMVPWKTNSRLSVRMATARNVLSLLKARSTVPALLVGLRVEHRWSPARGSLAGAGFLLVAPLRDGRLDPTSAQVGTNLAVRVRLVGQQPGGSGPWPAATGPADPQPTHQRLERQRVMALSSSGNAGQRPTSGIGQQMNRRAQPAAGTPQRFPISTRHFRRRRIPVIRPSPL